MNKRPIRSLLALLAASTIALAPARAATDTGAPDIAEMVRSTSLAGSFLAAQIATKQNDDDAASSYYQRSLELDPDNTELKRLYFLALTATGQIAKAAEIARSVPSTAEQSAVVRMVMAVDAMKKKSWAKVAEILKSPGRTDLDMLIEKTVLAWSVFGAGDAKQAIEIASTIEGPDWALVVRDYHAGLIAAASGDDKQAESFLASATGNEAAAAVLSETFARAMEALARSQARMGEIDKAKETVERGGRLFSNHAPFDALKADLDASRPLAPLVASAQQGAGEIFFNIGTAISRQGGTPFAQGYLQLADYLSPGSDVVIMALAGVYEAQKRQERANAYYERIAPDSAYHRRAELEYALNLNDLKRVDESKAKLRALVAENPDDILTYMTLGGLLSQHEEYEEASKVYHEAMARLGEPGPRDWNVFYRAAIAHERLKQWDQAEPLFRKALELSPRQADVLNYLGYSWIDMGRNLEEGLDMIRKAVDLSPRKGYIIDSLGWAYYRLGRYDEAVTELERAVQMLPQDPTLNDHLGDAYWKTGRKLEATFQWNHALANEPQPGDEAKIREKLEKGLVEDEKPTLSAN